MIVARKCKIDECNHPGFTKKSGTTVYPNGYCGMHYQQIRKHGCIIITRYTPRPAIIQGDIAKIPLGINAKDGYAIVDSNMSWLADEYQWHKCSHGYATTNIIQGRNKLKRMHSMIMHDTKASYEVDHINRDRLDNRCENLRLVTRSQNNMNKTKQVNTRSVYKGVIRRGNKWAANIRKDGKSYYLKAYYSEREAAMAYDKKALELFGKYANTNILKSNSDTI